MGETPILFEDRRAGISKINKAEVVKALQVILQLGVDRLLGRATLTPPSASRPPRARVDRPTANPSRRDQSDVRL